MPNVASSKFALICLAGLAVCVARPATAQQTATGPVTGQWAAEAGFGGVFDGATLIHLATGQHAWLFGLTGSEQHETAAIGTTVLTNDVHTVDAQLGMRHYSASSDALRPYVGAGLIGGIRDLGSTHTWDGGAYGELGAAYFLTPHLSLGADGRLQGQYQKDRTGAGSDHAWLFQFGLARLTAAVYF